MNKVSQNQNFEVSAETWNSFIDAAQYVKNMQNGMEADELNDALPVGQVWVQNDSGEDRDLYDCLALPDLVLTPDQDNLDDFDFQDIVFSGEECTEDNAKEPVCILQEPLADGEVGKALVIGVTHGDVDIQDTSHRYAAPDTGNPGKLISAESGPIEIMWQEGAQTGDQKVILKMGGSGGSSQNYPFMLFTGKDEDTDEPVLKMKQGTVYLQSIHEDWGNYRYGSCDSFSDDEVIDFDWTGVSDGDYMIAGWAKWSKEESLECGISIMSDSYSDSFYCPFGCGFYAFLIGIVTKETDDDGNVKLSVTKQLAAGHVTIADRYLGLPFVPHIDVTVPDTSTLTKPSDIVATNASLDTTPSYNDAEKKYEDLSDPGESLSKGNTYYCYIKDDGKDREIVWSTSTIQAYQSSEGEESEESTVHTLVAKLDYRSDNLLDTELYHLSPYRGATDTYKVKVNKDDKEPDFIEKKIKSKDKTITIKADTLDSKKILNLEMNVQFMGSLEKFVEVEKDDNDEKKVRWKPEYDSGSVTVEGVGDKCSFFIAQEAETKKLTRWTWGNSDEYKHGVFYWDYSVKGGLPKTTVPPKPTEETTVWVLGGTESGGLLWYPYNNLSLTLKGSITEVFEIADDEEDTTKKVLRVKTEYDGSIDQYHFLNLDKSGKLTLTTFNGDVGSNGKKSLMCWDWTNKEPTLTVTPDKSEESIWILSGNKTDGLQWLDLNDYLYTVKVSEEDTEADYLFNKLASPHQSILIEQTATGAAQKVNLEINPEFFTSENESIRIQDMETSIDFTINESFFVSSDGTIDIETDEEGKLDFTISVPGLFALFSSENESIRIQNMEDTIDFTINETFFKSSDGTIDIETDEEGKLDFTISVPGLFALFSSENESIRIQNMEDTIDFTINETFFKSSDGTIDIETDEEGKLDFTISVPGLFALFSSENDSIRIQNMEDTIDFTINESFFVSSDGTIDIETDEEGKLDFTISVPGLFALFSSENESIRIQNMEDTIDFTINETFFKSSDGTIDIETDEEGKLDFTISVPGLFALFSSENDSIRIQNMEDSIDFTINESFFVSSDGSIDITTDESGKLDFSSNGKCKVSESDEAGYLGEQFEDSEHITFENDGDTIKAKIADGAITSSDDSIEIDTSDGVFDLKSNGKVKVTADDTPGYLEEKLMDTETIKMEQSNGCYFKADLQDGALNSPSGSLEINRDGVFQLDVNWEKVVIDSSLSGLIQVEYLPDHGGVKLKSALDGNGLLVVNGGSISVLEGQANCVLACTGSGFSWLPYSDCTNACE